MLQPKLKVTVDYENSTLRNATGESVWQFLNVVPDSGSKKNHTICPTVFRASVRSVEHVWIDLP
jgi:hypothetical protein